MVYFWADHQHQWYILTFSKFCHTRKKSSRETTYDSQGLVEKRMISATLMAISKQLLQNHLFSLPLHCVLKYGTRWRGSYINNNIIFINDLKVLIMGWNTDEWLKCLLLHPTDKWIKNDIVLFKNVLNTISSHHLKDGCSSLQFFVH